MSLSTHLGSRIPAFGLHPNITTLEQYEDTATLGLIRARLRAQADPDPNPDPATIAAYHRIIFEHVYPWAEPDRVVRELEMLNLQNMEVLEQAGTERDVLSALAFAHVHFERIHPFRDGNGRLGRVLLDGQLDAMFGARARPVLDRDHYLSALRTATRGDLADLTNLLGAREGVIAGLSGPCLAPFRLAPFMSDGIGSALKEDLACSRVRTGH